MRFAARKLPDMRVLPDQAELIGVPQALTTALGERLASARLRAVDRPSEAAALVMIGHVLGDGAPIDLHWRCLVSLREALQAGAQTILLLQDTGGDFSGGTSAGFLGGLAGLARTARAEWPGRDVRMFDIALERLGAGEAARALIAALGSDAPELGLPGHGEGRVPVLGVIAGEGGKAPGLADKPVWLVSGGARGVTADCVVELARRSGGCFALLGRSVPSPWPQNVAPCDDLRQLRGLLARAASERGDKLSPGEINASAQNALAGREIRATLQRLQSVGARAQYFPCDLADRSAVRQTVVAASEAFGPVTGLVHGAGVLADRLMAEKTREEFDRVFSTKVTGLAHLLDALDLDALTHIALFSSAATAFGNAGQADYAIANEVLNRVAWAVKAAAPGKCVKSFNWGPWDGGMVDETLARQFRARGVSLISRAAGAGVFADQMLAGHPGDVELVIGESWTA